MSDILKKLIQGKSKSPEPETPPEPSYPETVIQNRLVVDWAKFYHNLYQSYETAHTELKNSTGMAHVYKAAHVDALGDLVEAFNRSAKWEKVSD